MSSQYTGAVPQWLENNKSYVTDTFSKLPAPWHMTDRGPLARASGQVTLVLTCLDPRCVPENFFGPNMEGGAIRNAGGRATDDAIRSITVLRSLLNVKQVAVVHHTDCGVTHLQSQDVINYAAADGPGAKAAAENIDYKLFSSENIEDSVREDVKVLINAPTLSGLNFYGFVLDTFTGKVSPVDA